MTGILDLLTSSQAARYKEFQSFVSDRIQNSADQWDRDQKLPDSIITELADAGYLGSTLPPQFGGSGWDAITFGLLSEALGRGSSSVAVLITVQAMVTMALLKWGTPDQKAEWLPPLAKGKMLAAFALTEPGAGSATDSLTTELKADGSDGFTLQGTKRWISCAQMAGVFLVFGKLEQQPTACLVPRNAPGLCIEPITDLLGFRAAGLAQVSFDGVKIPAANMVGKPGFALSHVATLGLQHGRISTACSGLGLLRGCFEESIAFASSRKIGENYVGDLGMIRSLITRMGTDLQAGRLLCHDACRAEDDHSPAAFEKTLMAKYFTSRAAGVAASDAVQIRGASGCHDSSPVARYYRDSKIMQIIEGTTQIHEQLLGKMFVGQAARIATKTV
jgi:alkylation response protein AidB-like acyl-CoA dehydrogenase